MEFCKFETYVFAISIGGLTSNNSKLGSEFNKFATINLTVGLVRPGLSYKWSNEQLIYDN
jgi:hypothetical protein